MDDVLCGAATLEEAIVLRLQLKGILKSAGMELHKLCANHEKLSPDPEQNYDFATLTETKTLGVSWKPNLDCFLIQVKVCLDSSYTKRDVLSTIANIFDPVGLMAPVISKAKIFLQQVIEIHGFADASERCYGAAVYCKSKNLKSETLVRLITRKSRVAPIKSPTIPRLELCAAVLLAKLVKRVVAALQLETAELYLWSDSMIVLAWLRKEPMDLKTFVQNRVAKIQEIYPNQLWRHVPSDQNPADLVYRGVDPDKLLQQNLWFNGATFLSAKPIVSTQIMGNLPKERLITDYPFNCSGADFSGPIFIKNKGQRKGNLFKVYICIFVCFVFKAVHIELVSDLTSQAFIAALKRFMARRGKYAKLVSNNGKNFVGASNEIKKLLEIDRNQDEKN
ncbi:integrase catalytic domain-containing protein [Trichonephila clavipes]|nr:integrase catalytic domain-containing protein [Trichonephila clavipes]